MKFLCVLLPLAALIRIGGCPPTPAPTPDSVAAVGYATSAYVAVDFAMLDGPLVEPDDTPDVPDDTPSGDCSTCNNTGCVKSGDGLSWVNCYDCDRTCSREGAPGEVEPADPDAIPVQILWDHCQGNYCRLPEPGDRGTVVGGEHDGRRVYQDETNKTRFEGE